MSGRTAALCAAAAILAVSCGRTGPGRAGERTAFMGTDAEKRPACAASCAASDGELRERLTPEQYRVTRCGGTEPPFANAYWNNKRAGVYVDVVDGTPLFASTAKFDSGTGWPSFTAPVKPAAVETRTDRSHGMVRTEVRARKSGSHLGHVFDDGPAPAGLRYCINSAALRFVPVEEMEKEGYGALLRLVGGVPPAK